MYFEEAVEVAYSLRDHGWKETLRRFDPKSRAPYPVVYVVNTGVRKQRGLSRLARSIVEAAEDRGFPRGPVNTCSWACKWARTVRSYTEQECVETLQRACDYLISLDHRG